MDITIQKTQEQPDFQRTLYTVSCVYDGKATPSRMTLKEDIAKKVKAKPEVVIVRNVTSSYGGGGATVTVVAYKDEKSIKQFEPQHIIKKNTPAPAEEKEE